MTISDLYYACSNVNKWDDITLYQDGYSRTLSLKWSERQADCDREVIWFRVDGNRMEVGVE